MPGNFKKEDLRVRKTRKALLDSLYNLVEQRGFSGLSVFDICERALVSRSAFYVHFRDKYDLLEQLLRAQVTQLTRTSRDCGQREREERFARLLLEKRRYLRNLLEDADGEQLRILFDVLAVEYDPHDFSRSIAMDNPSRTAFLSFVSGGAFNALRNLATQSGHNESTATAWLHRFFDLLKHIYEWPSIQGSGGGYGK